MTRFVDSLGNSLKADENAMNHTVTWVLDAGVEDLSELDPNQLSDFLDKAFVVATIEPDNVTEARAEGRYLAFEVD